MAFDILANNSNKLFIACLMTTTHVFVCGHEKNYKHLSKFGHQNINLNSFTMSSQCKQLSQLILITFKETTYQLRILEPVMILILFEFYMQNLINKAFNLNIIYLLIHTYIKYYSTYTHAHSMNKLTQSWIIL